MATAQTTANTVLSGVPPKQKPQIIPLLPEAAPVPLVNRDRPISPGTPLSRIVTATDESVIFTNPSSVDSTNTTTTHSQCNGENNRDLHEDNTDPLSSLPHGSSDDKNDNDDDEFYDTYENASQIQPPVQASTIKASENTQPPSLVKRTGSHASHSSNVLEPNRSASYIQGSTNENVLLNNYTRKRKSTTRTNSVATILDQQAQRSAANTSNTIRNSVVTQDSRNVDTATIEIERMRNSVLTQREKKKKLKNMIDDDKVLVGNKVSEGHVNYVVAYNMLTGIRVAVSRVSGIMHPLKEEDFKASKKLVFDVSGNELTPSSKYDFKFKDYAPSVFRELRILFGLDPADYLMSLTSKYILSELNSPGKSGSFFYFSRDYRFIIKTIHPAEHRQLRKVLKHYYQHVKENPNTMISQFYGLHRVKMPITYGKRRKIYFIIMNNLFPSHRDIHCTYDLKGSTLGRYTDPNKGSHVVLKDLNWLADKEVIKFGPLKEKIFLEQLQKDVKLLIKMNIMDYSFLIGIHDLTKDADDDILKRKKLSVFSPISSNMHDLQNTNPKLLNHLKDMPAIEYHNGNCFYAEEGGISSTGPHNEPEQFVYYLGIIDCLTKYSFIKRMETFWRTLRHDRKTVSAVPPPEYGQRFLNFIQNSVNENTAGEIKKKAD
ncbi:hypothetical protein BON22_0290 [Cyberlindnera fabianii]|uniref:1-phosphatidylinositol-4-phosphate 5-kinase n=1 Tax=Cyberlindnera fabianii TaxID=36022 RepID=A0A1V2LE50_CYBFA|nr:hypothetical protein BON22_0290 [Cyberlindnera fabianii]